MKKDAAHDDVLTNLAAGQGFEPQLLDPESSVLPLDYPASQARISVSIRRTDLQISRVKWCSLHFGSDDCSHPEAVERILSR
jgi:hypothetical protein